MGRGQARMTITMSKGYRPGAIGRVAELHAAYYHREVTFGLFFESRVARELAEFCERYDDSRDGLWLAMNGNDVEGSIAIDGLGARARRAFALVHFFRSCAWQRDGNRSACSCYGVLPVAALPMRLPVDLSRPRRGPALIREIRIQPGSPATRVAMGRRSE